VASQEKPKGRQVVQLAPGVRLTTDGVGPEAGLEVSVFDMAAPSTVFHANWIAVEETASEVLVGFGQQVPTRDRLESLVVLSMSPDEARSAAKMKKDTGDSENRSEWFFDRIKPYMDRATLQPGKVSDFRSIAGLAEPATFARCNLMGLVHRERDGEVIAYRVAVRGLHRIGQGNEVTGDEMVEPLVVVTLDVTLLAALALRFAAIK
jgi:hypothetical protein